MAIITLKGRANFKRVLAHGQRRRLDGLCLYCGANDCETNRYGIMVTAKAGHAVVRNKVRRWAKELLRGWHPLLAPGYDVVLLANRPEVAESFSSFSTHLAGLLRRLELTEAQLVR